MPPRPSLRDVLELGRALRPGSAIDAPKSRLGMLRELVGDTPRDSPLTMRAALRRTVLQDLMTPEVSPGDPAPDFALPRHDFGDGGGGEGDGDGAPTGEVVRLSRFRGVLPVALIFGSYT